MLQDIQKHHHTTNIIITLFVTAICAAILVFALLYYFEHRPSRLVSHVSIGSLEYTREGNTLVKRTDTSANDLRAFLEQLNETSGCTQNVYHEVIAATPDEKQVLLRYGCDFANARMFATKNDGIWEALSPTNQFDQFGIPLCDYVTSNNISRLIAPVCVAHTAGSDPQYITR